MQLFLGELVSGSFNFYSQFRQVFDALGISEAILQTQTEPLMFMKHVSPLKTLRDASSEADRLIEEYKVDSSRRMDLFQAKLAAEKAIKASGEWGKLSVEQQRLVDKMILDGTRLGLMLAEDAREELKKLQKDLHQTEQEFRVSLWFVSLECILTMDASEKYYRGYGMSSVPHQNVIHLYSYRAPSPSH